MEHRLDIRGMPLIVVLRAMMYRDPGSVVSRIWEVSEMWGPNVSLPKENLAESVFDSASLLEKNDLQIRIDGRKLLLESALLVSIEEATIRRVSDINPDEFDVEFSLDEGYIIVYTSDRDLYGYLRAWLAQERIQRVLNSGI